MQEEVVGWLLLPACAKKQIEPLLPDNMLNIAFSFCNPVGLSSNKTQGEK